MNGNVVPAKDFPDGLLSYDKSGKDKLKKWAVAAYDRWNTMLAERASAADFQVIDLYHPFNGPDGKTTYYPELSDDGAHPNQAGNDLIAAQLAQADLSALTSR